MRAYLIVRAGAEPISIRGVDALMLNGPPPSLRAAGEAMTERTRAGSAEPRLLVRIEGIDTPDLEAGLATLACLRPDAVVLPARHGRDVAHLGARLAVLEAEYGLPDRGIGIVALVADAAGALAAGSFAGASERLCGLGWDARALAGQLGMTGGPTEAGWSPPLAQIRTTVRIAAAAAGVEAIEAAYPGEDVVGLGSHVAAARRDGFAAVFARDPAQARLVRGEG